MMLRVYVVSVVIGLQALSGGLQASMFVVQKNDRGNSLVRSGSNCLYIAMDVFNQAPDTLAKVEAQLGKPSSSGHSLMQLKQAAEHFGLHAESVQTSIENLQARTSPYVLIAQLKNENFVVVVEFKEGKVHVVDPPKEFTIPEVTFSSQWPGVALLISNEVLESEESLTDRRWKTAMRKRGLWTIGVLTAVALGAWTLRKYRRRA